MSNGIYESPSSDVSNNSDEVVKLGVKDVLFSFQGRIPRSTYWLSILGLLVVSIVLMVVVGMVVIGGSASFVFLILVLYIPFIWVSFALQVKRWHDRDKSGWWILISLIPVVGPIWAFVELGCLAGSEGANQFGPPAV